MTDGLEKLFRWTFKYGRIIAYITAAVIALDTRSGTFGPASPSLTMF